MNLKVTTLIENTIGEHLALTAEHGISFLIEYQGTKILFDTGQSDAFIKNAEIMQLNLKDVNHIVLSHGHYDHSGGFPSMVDLTDRFKLWLGTGFFTPKYGKRNDSYEFLGNNFKEDFLQDHSIDYTFVKDDVTQIVPNIYIVTNFPRVNENEVINPRFVLLEKDGFTADPFTDEVLIAIDTPKGLVVLLGCSHPGMKNMLDAVKKHFNKEIYAVLGGTHLVEANDVCLKESLDYLKSGDIDIIGVSHCTGPNAMKQLSDMTSRYFHNRTGTSLFVEL
jgi:7,8-dihydropterin-6-yl-methyl-4-(beta-D-ribofuranosyl)aminobenzene 5'-phosphate synthase